MVVSGRKPNPGKYVHPGAAKISDQGTSFRKAVEDQEEAIRMRDLLRRSIAALSALAKNESAAVCERLADFKNSVQKATAIEQIETSLSALRNAIVKSEQLVDVGTGPNVRDLLCKPAQTVPLIDANGHRKELQSIFLGLISEFDHDFGEEYSGRLATLREKIEQSAQIEDLVGLKDDIIALVQTYNQMINEERSLVTDFISEIGAGLLEVERQYLDSINQTGQSHERKHKIQQPARKSCGRYEKIGAAQHYARRVQGPRHVQAGLHTNGPGGEAPV